MATFTKSRGEDFIIQYIVEDAAHLDGFTVGFFVFQDKGEPALLSKQSTTPGHMEIFENRILIHFASSETNYSQSVITEGTYECELWLTDSTGKEARAAADTFILVESGRKIA